MFGVKRGGRKEVGSSMGGVHGGKGSEEGATVVALIPWPLALSGARAFACISPLIA